MKYIFLAQTAYSIWLCQNSFDIKKPLTNCNLQKEKVNLPFKHSLLCCSCGLKKKKKKWGSYSFKLVIPRAGDKLLLGAFA